MKFKWLYFLPLPIIIISIIIFFVNSKTPEQEENTTNSIPQINVSLNNINLSDIIVGTKSEKHTDNSLTIIEDKTTETFNNVEIRGHGNSTWGLPKSPFQIKFKNKVNLFGMGAAKKWILLANFLDKSNLRTDVAFYLEEMLEENYALEGRFINLYIDNEYQGLYYITEKVEIDKNRIRLKDDLGIVVELESLHADIENCYRTKENACLVIHDSVVRDNEKDAMESFVEDFNSLEQAAKIGDYSTVKQLIDTTSFAKYFLLSEFTANPDAYISSFFLYKDGFLDKIHAGPGWDYDLSLGNHIWIWARTENYYTPENIFLSEKYAFGGEMYDEVLDEYIELTPDKSISRLLFYLYKIPEFKTEVEQLYRKYLAGKKEEVIDFIREEANIIYDSAISDKELWHDSNSNLLDRLDSTLVKTEDAKNNILHNNLSSEESFNLEVDYLINWISRRFDRFDHEYNENIYPSEIVTGNI